MKKHLICLTKQQLYPILPNMCVFTILLFFMLFINNTICLTEYIHMNTILYLNSLFTYFFICSRHQGSSLVCMVSLWHLLYAIFIFWIKTFTSAADIWEIKRCWAVFCIKPWILPFLHILFLLKHGYDVKKHYICIQW